MKDILDTRVNKNDLKKRLRENKSIRVVPEKVDEEQKQDDQDIPELRPKKTKRKVTIASVSKLEGEEQENVTQTRVRRTERPAKNVSTIPHEEWVQVNNTDVITRLPPPLPTADLRVSGFYLNNRKKFIDFINSYFSEYRDEILNEKLSLSCDDLGKDNNAEFKLLMHQKIVRDYINLYSPYRGLLCIMV